MAYLEKLERMIEEAKAIRDKDDVENNPELFFGLTTNNYIQRRAEERAKRDFDRFDFYCKNLRYT